MADAAIDDVGVAAADANAEAGAAAADDNADLVAANDGNAGGNAGAVGDANPDVDVADANAGGGNADIDVAGADAGGAGDAAVAGDNEGGAGAAAENAAVNDAPDAPDAGNNADVGILNADTASSSEDEEEAQPTNLFDVWEALGDASYTGSFCSADIADGSTLTPALPSSPGLKINGVGDMIPLPLSDWHAKAIKANRHTAKVEDESFHKVYSVDSQRVRIKNPAWEAKLASLLQTVAYRLGVDPEKLSAKLDTLLLMEKGSQVKRCSNDEEDDSVMGTLLVQLPSAFKGGKMSIFHVGEKEDDDVNETEEEVMAFDMGGAPGSASFACHFVAHYKDCEYEIAKVISGHRVLLRYSLRYKGFVCSGCDELHIPTVAKLNSSMKTITGSMAELPPSDRVFLVPLAKEYKAVDLGRLGINALSHHHRSRFEAVKVSMTGKGWKVLLLNAELSHTHRTGYYGNTISSNRDSSIVQIFDEEGNDVTAAEEWLKSIINLTPLDVGNGMILNFDEEDYEESWGNTISDKYISSFILAYDATLADAELQCLRGSAGVAEVTDKVVAARNYPMLERMLAVIESKANVNFDVSSCKKVLQMLNRSRGKNATSSKRIEFARKTISGLGSSEPDTELYDAIRAAAAADKFGYDNIKTAVSELLSDTYRRENLELNLFLRRCDFILKLSRGHENDWLATLCQRMPHFGADSIADSGVINATIDGLISEHGWEAVSLAVKATLRFMHDKNRSNKTIGVLLDRARLLQKISDHPNDFVQSCLVDFAQDFSHGLYSYWSPLTTKQQLRGDNKQLFVKAIRNVIEHGTEEDHRRMGSWAICEQELFTLLLDVISEQATGLGVEPQRLIHKMLNKCLVVNATYSWYRHRGPDGKIPASLHVRKIIEDYPNLTRTPDGDGRLTLHCAVANASTAFETILDIFESYPEAASIRCPVSGLYPFMLAASNGLSSNDRVSKVLLGASFRLLLADPSLVAPADGEANRKRKRSASMDGQGI